MSMSNEEDRSIEKLGAVFLILLILCQWMFFPYIAVIKAEKGNFKFACAYIMGKEKTKYSYDTIIRIHEKDYKDRDILPLPHLASIGRDKWLTFPLGKYDEEFFTVSPKCKIVRYVEIYNIFGFKKFYLYDHVKEP